MSTSPNSDPAFYKINVLSNHPIGYIYRGHIGFDHSNIDAPVLENWGLLREAVRNSLKQNCRNRYQPSQSLSRLELIFESARLAHK